MTPRKIWLQTKDQASARESVRLLDGLPVSEQIKAVDNALQRLSNTMKRTKDDRKLNQLNAAEYFYGNYLINLYEKEVQCYFGYLHQGIIEAYMPLAKKCDITDFSFLNAYRGAHGNPDILCRKKQFSQEDNCMVPWALLRARKLNSIMKEVDRGQIFYNEGSAVVPTKEHLKAIMWGFSPDCDALVRHLSQQQFTETYYCTEFNCLKIFYSNILNDDVPLVTNCEEHHFYIVTNLVMETFLDIGFSDKKKAAEVLEFIKQENAVFQRMVAKFMFKTVKIALSCINIGNIKSNLEKTSSFLVEWLKGKNPQYEEYFYLPLFVLKGYEGLAIRYGIFEDKFTRDFYEAYNQVNGNVELLKQMPAVADNTKNCSKGENKSIDELRRAKLRSFSSSASPQFYNVAGFEGLPTHSHMSRIMLANTTCPDEVLAIMPVVQNKFGAFSRMYR